MKKYITISITTLIFTGCGMNVKNLTNFSQPSIAQQKFDAQNAWDELEGKKISIPKSSNSINIAKK